MPCQRLTPLGSLYSSCSVPRCPLVSAHLWPDDSRIAATAADLAASFNILYDRDSDGAALLMTKTPSARAGLQDPREGYGLVH